MTFDVTIDNMWEEVTFSEKERDKRLAVYDQQIHDYTSPFFKGELGELGEDIDYSPENVNYEAVRIDTPQSVFNNPRVRLNSRVYGTDDSVIELQYGVNQLVIENEYADYYIPFATEMQFACPVSMTTREEHRTLKLEDGSPAFTTKKTRISPRHYFKDIAAETHEETRFQGHSYTEDYGDVLEWAEEDQKLPEDEREGWDLEAIKGLQPGTGIEEHRRGLDGLPDRKELVIHEVWIRDYEGDDHPGAEEGFHGTIFTLCGAGETAQYIRDPYPYFGPPCGPYNTLWIHYVPGDPYGLPPAVATEGQSRDLNRHARGTSNSAAAYKRLIFVDDTDPELAERIEYGEHDLVIPVSGIGKDKVIDVEVGGITEQMLGYLQVAKERHERVRGITDTQRGRVTAGATATDAALSEANADIGTDFQKRQFNSFVRRDLKKDLYYLWKDPTQRVLLGPEAGRELGIPTVEELKQLGADESLIVEAVAAGKALAPGQKLTFAGGDERVEFSELALEIEPMSMERVTEGMAQRRMMEMFQLVTTAAQMVPMMPHVRWEEMLNKMGDALNIPDLGSMIDLTQVPPPMPEQSPQGNQPMGPSKIPAPTPMGKSPSMLEGVQTGGQMSGYAGAQ